MQFDKSQLWSFTFVSSINKNIDLVRNNFTGRLMIRRLSDSESYAVFEKLSEIRHPNLMSVYDVQLRDGICVSLCEYVNGTTLAYNIESCGCRGVNEAKKILIQICDGLSEMHRRGLVHRDIKPENVMIESGGRVKIIDFNITRLIKPDKSKDTYVLGTAGYASPEQFGFGQTSEKADIYACGVLLNFLLTGRLPDEELHQGQLRTVIERCIEIDESKRYRSAEDLKRVLQGKKLNTRRSFSPLPGFRGRHIFPKILTTILMAAWAFMLFVIINALPMIFDSEVKYIIRQLIIAADFLLFWSLIPYMLFGDVFRLSERINPDNPSNGKYVLRILGTVSILLGFILLIAGVYITRLL